MSLDPKDWSLFREQAHQVLDLALDHVATLRDRPLWRAPPTRDDTSIPYAGRELKDVVEEFERTILPFGSGNTHPGFMGWVQGAGTPVGMIAELLSATMNANCGGRHHAAIEVEREVSAWMRDLFGLPPTARGLFTTGASQANFIAILMARHRALGSGVRRRGYDALTARLTAYASAEVHGCVARAMDLSGLGTDALRLVKTDDDYRIDLDMLRRMVDQDRASGFRPFLLVGNAGSVNTGSIDPLAALGEIARAEDIHFHVDAALGAFALAAPQLAARFEGIQAADSIAFDFHKWAHVPYDAGFLLSRSAADQDSTFSSDAAYLSRAGQGLAAGAWWPTDSGPDLSRGFRALKAWFTLKTFGLDEIGRHIQDNCRSAAHLAERIRAEPRLVLEAPVALSIVCFGFAGADGAARNRRIVGMLHEDGHFAPSLSMLNGRPIVRAAILNHRTTDRDMDLFLDRMLDLDASAGPVTERP